MIRSFAPITRLGLILFRAFANVFTASAGTGGDATSGASRNRGGQLDPETLKSLSRACSIKVYSRTERRFPEHFGISHIIRYTAFGGRARKGKRMETANTPGDDMQRASILMSGFTHVSNQKRPKSARKSPCGQHEPVDGADIFRTEIIGSKCRHGSKSTAVTHQHKRTRGWSEAMHRGRLDRARKAQAWMANMTTKVSRRVSMSDNQRPQNTRPIALPMETIPTIPAATMAVTFASS